MKKNSFTLIELLLVTAIIGILVSILLPSLLKAREASRKIVCLSNLKQIGSVLNLYTKNNSGYYPPKAAWNHQTSYLGEYGLTRRMRPSQRYLNPYVIR